MHYVFDTCTQANVDRSCRREVRASTPASSSRHYASDRTWKRIPPIRDETGGQCCGSVATRSTRRIPPDAARRKARKPRRSGRRRRWRPSSHQAGRQFGMTKGGEKVSPLLGIGHRHRRIGLKPRRACSPRRSFGTSTTHLRVLEVLYGTHQAGVDRSEGRCVFVGHA